VRKTLYVIVVLKTREELANSFTAKIKQLCSYDCPFIVSAPVTQGNLDFLAWTDAETASDH